MAKAFAAAGAKRPAAASAKRPAPPVAGSSAFYNGCKFQRSDGKQAWRVFIPSTNHVDRTVSWRMHGGEAPAWRAALALAALHEG